MEKGWRLLWRFPREEASEGRLWGTDWLLEQEKRSKSQSSSNKECAVLRASELRSWTLGEEVTGGSPPQDGNLPDAPSRGLGPCHMGPRREMEKVGKLPHVVSPQPCSALMAILKIHT